MSSLNLYDGSIIIFIGGLTTLSNILTKAEQYAKDNSIPEKEFIEARLAPDMNPLTFQIQTASDTARRALARLTGKEPVAFADSETSFAELQERIAKSLDLLKAAKREDFDFDAEAEIKLPLGKDEQTLTKKHFVRGFAVPNFQFHVVTAYAILRMKGVKIGKSDYIRPYLTV